MTQTSKLEDLPAELISYILQYLSLADMGQLCRASAIFNRFHAPVHNLHLIGPSLLIPLGHSSGRLFTSLCHTLRSGEAAFLTHVTVKVCSCDTVARNYILKLFSELPNLKELVLFIPFDISLWLQAIAKEANFKQWRQLSVVTTSQELRMANLIAKGDASKSSKAIFTFTSGFQWTRDAAKTLLSEPSKRTSRPTVNASRSTPITGGTMVCVRKDDAHLDELSRKDLRLYKRQSNNEFAMYRREADGTFDKVLLNPLAVRLR